MKQFPFRRSVLGGAVAGLVSVCAAAPAMAITLSPALSAVPSTPCTAPALTQPFLAWGDSNWYTLPPGESPDAFTGAGWTLSGGASVVSTTLGDRTTGTVLNLPSGSEAVSPTICVDYGYQTARTQVRDLAGSEGVQFYVSYAGTSTWNTPQNTGQVHGNGTAWTLSTPVNVQPSAISGWQKVRFVFIPGGKTSDFQIYNFYVDPRMRN